MAVRQPTLRGVPRKSPLGGYLYVIRFDTDVIKVGMSVAPAGRLRAHHAYSRGLGISITDQWVSVPHKQTLANEKELITFCRANASRTNAREYFVGLDFTSVIGYAETLPYIPAADAATAHDVPNAPRWRQTYETLQERIVAGLYEPGVQLPSYAAICDEFGISQVTAKRVLSELRKAGLAEMQVGIGTFVTELPQPGS